MSKEYTSDEVREWFLRTVSSIVRYWASVDLKDSEFENEMLYRCEGVAFSILSSLDSCNAGLPAFIVAPIPHEADKLYHIDIGEDYYPENHNLHLNCDIAGALHELLGKYQRRDTS